MRRQVSQATYDPFPTSYSVRRATASATKTHGLWHASGTCLIGAVDDPDAVVDPCGRVIGVAGLRVRCVPDAVHALRQHQSTDGHNHRADERADPEAGRLMSGTREWQGDMLHTCIQLAVFRS